MMRHRLALLGLITAMWPMAANAGDAARLNILGFSEDGGIFAFEEYGVQDGSGFPYANRFYIDTSTDRFLARTPVRIRIDDENASVATARDEARRLGESATSLDDSNLTANIGNTVASNPVTELSADPFKVKVNPRPVFPAIDSALTFTLVETAERPSAACQNIGEIKGFRLFLHQDKPGAEPEALHVDTSVPASRGCPQGYSIGAIQSYFPDRGTSVIAVLVAVRSFGFEGPDHRWLAVTTRRPTSQP